MSNETLWKCIYDLKSEIIILDGIIDEAINSSQLCKISKKNCYRTWQNSKINAQKKYKYRKFLLEVKNSGRNDLSEMIF